MISAFKEKYRYSKYHINKVDGLRYYSISENLNVPSVTSILKKTNSDKWYESSHVSDSIEIGNYMHTYLNHYISKNNDFVIESKNYSIAKKLAQTVIDNLIVELDEVWGSEATVLYKEQYAGTIDLIGVIDGKVTLIDYKSSYRRKNENEINEYFLQLAAYALAHDWQYHTKIESIIVFLAIRNGDFEKIIINDELYIYKEKWLSRLEEFLG
tara:strand:+ start:1580 stop:2215 length:636 start_codon:yes stop_codon:yes gene_type:complete